MISLGSALGAPSMNYFSKLTNPPIFFVIILNRLTTTVVWSNICKGGPFNVH